MFTFSSKPLPRAAAPLLLRDELRKITVKSVEYCWARVEQSERTAAGAIKPKRKAVFEELAGRWRQLAGESKSEALKPIGGRRPTGVTALGLVLGELKLPCPVAYYFP